MSRRQLEFFAVGSDLVSVLVAVAHESPFLLATLKPGERRCELRTPTEVCDLSIASHGSQAHGRSYLLVRPDVPVATRTVEQRRGGEVTVLDQMSHPESVFLRPGGEFDGAVVAGQIGTINDRPWALDLYGKLSKAMTKDFEKVKSYRVGPEAARLLNGGKRLTTNTASPVEFDLCR